MHDLAGLKKGQAAERGAQQHPACSMIRCNTCAHQSSSQYISQNSQTVDYATSVRVRICCVDTLDTENSQSLNLPISGTLHHQHFHEFYMYIDLLKSDKSFNCCYSLTTVHSPGHLTNLPASPGTPSCAGANAVAGNPARSTARSCSARTCSFSVPPHRVFRTSHNQGSPPGGVGQRPSQPFSQAWLVHTALLPRWQRHLMTLPTLAQAALGLPRDPTPYWTRERLTLLQGRS